MCMSLAVCVWIFHSLVLLRYQGCVCRGRVSVLPLPVVTLAFPHPLLHASTSECTQHTPSPNTSTHMSLPPCLPYTFHTHGTHPFPPLFPPSLPQARKRSLAPAAPRASATATANQASPTSVKKPPRSSSFAMPSDQKTSVCGLLTPFLWASTGRAPWGFLSMWRRGWRGGWRRMPGGMARWVCRRWW